MQKKLDKLRIRLLTCQFKKYITQWLFWSTSINCRVWIMENQDKSCDLLNCFMWYFSLFNFHIRQYWFLVRTEQAVYMQQYISWKKERYHLSFQKWPVIRKENSVPNYSTVKHLKEVNPIFHSNVIDFYSNLFF